MRHATDVEEPTTRTATLIDVTVAVAATTLGGVALLARSGASGHVASGVALYALLAAGYLWMGVAVVRRALRSAVAPLPGAGALLAGPIVLLAAIAVYAMATGLPLAERLMRFAPYLLLPPLLLLRQRTREARPPALELLVALALWLPIEWRLLPPMPLPAPSGFDVRKLIALADGMYLFLVARPLDGIGFTYRLRASDVTSAVAAFAAYALVAIPIGLATGFIAWHPMTSAGRVALLPLLIYITTGIPEEFLFRGLIQNLLARWLGIRLALPLASIVFGLAHLPDPRYALLATIAGLAYGWVYWRTRRITASAVTHGLVDAAWGAIFRG